MDHPEFNVWVGGRWYGPSYPDAGMPVRETVSAPVETARGQDPATTEPPPKSGAGSSRTKWAEYAAAHNVAFTDDDSRDDIIDACQAAGVNTD